MTGSLPLAVTRSSQRTAGQLLRSAFLETVIGCSAVSAVLCAASTASAASGETAPAQSAPANTADDLATKVEAQYLVGPVAAGELGFRIAWQARLQLARGAQLRQTRFSDEAIFVVDSVNSITRLRPSDGEQIWRVAVGSPVDIFRGIDWIMAPVRVPGRGTASAGMGRGTAMPREPRVYVTTDTECYVLDGSSGSIAGRQRFSKLPATKPVLSDSGKFLIYGTLGGQVVWYHALIGSEWRANSLDSTIRGQLLNGPGYIVAASDRGLVMAMDEVDARQLWSRRLYAGVSATPAVSDNKVFVAGLDQYLWCLNLRDGSVAWKHFTQTPLLSSPFPIADVVLQAIPGEGLVCFNVETTELDGDLRWKNVDVVGAPIGMITTGGGDRIVLWDQPSRTLSLVDPAYGTVSSKRVLPGVAELSLVNDGPYAGDIFATGDDGRVLRLIPKYRKVTDPSEAERADSKNTSVPPSIPPGTN